MVLVPVTHITLSRERIDESPPQIPLLARVAQHVGSVLVSSCVIVILCLRLVCLGVAKFASSTSPRSAPA